MGVFSGWQSTVQSAAATVANLAGQAVSMLKLTLTQATGQDALAIANNGARIHHGAGASDFSSSDGTTVTFAGPVITSGFTNASGNAIIQNATLQISSSAGTFFFNNAAATCGFITTNISAANAGNTGATAALKLMPQNALDATDFVTSIQDNASANLFAVAFNGSVQTPNTDSSGTPGNATANTIAGKAAIALGAAACVISNTLVTANSRIFISPRLRDATGLLPIVSAQVAGTSFTVSVTANCTAALPFDWWVID